MESLVRYRYPEPPDDLPTPGLVEAMLHLAEIAAYREDQLRSAGDIHSVPHDSWRAEI